MIRIAARELVYKSQLSTYFPAGKITLDQELEVPNSAPRE